MRLRNDWKFRICQRMAGPSCNFLTTHTPGRNVNGAQKLAPYAFSLALVAPGIVGPIALGNRNSPLRELFNITCF